MIRTRGEHTKNKKKFNDFREGYEKLNNREARMKKNNKYMQAYDRYVELAYVMERYPLKSAPPQFLQENNLQEGYEPTLPKTFIADAGETFIKIIAELKEDFGADHHLEQE